MRVEVKGRREARRWGERSRLERRGGGWKRREEKNRV